MGPFKGWPDILVNAIPSVFAFDLQFVCFYICLSLFSFLKPFEKHFFLANDDGH